jgi:hypothetical protein
MGNIELFALLNYHTYMKEKVAQEFRGTRLIFLRLVSLKK